MPEIERTDTTGSEALEVRAFLTRCAAGQPYPDGEEGKGRAASSVEIFETHGAVVFVGPEVTYKIKRPVAFSYMDFSTLEKRETAIRREFEINRENAPRLYLDVCPITQSDDGPLALDGPGTTIDWVLRMRSFPQADLLSERIKSGSLPVELVHGLAAMVAESHTNAVVRLDADPVTQATAIIADLDAAFGASPHIFNQDKRQKWRAAVAAALESCRETLNQRAVEGYVRRCHGDLHLGNIVLWEGRPTLFDAIEFDEKIATVDVLYDLAFLLMDLDERGHGAEANGILGRYLWHTGRVADLDGLKALPLFMSMRAGVRAMVRSQHAGNAKLDGSGAGANDARKYFQYACRVLEPARVKLVAVGGLSGTGKSTLARCLSPGVGRAPGAVHLRSDLERKAMLGVPETERVDVHYYTAEMSDKVYARLFERARHCLRAGQSVVLDAVFSTPEERAAAEDLAAVAGAEFQGLWLDAPLATLQQRVRRRVGDASDATESVVAEQLKRGVGSVAWTVIDASGAPRNSLDQARQALEGR